MRNRYLLTCSLLFALAESRCAMGDAFYQAQLDASQVLNNASDSTATGRARFQLNNARTHLSYWLDLEGLDLEAEPANRTDPNDVVAIHLHLHVADLVGPHILNIFGTPSEDDADLVVDYEHESLSGVYDMSDGVDRATGEPFFQDDPLATKLIANWIDELDAGQLYIAVHSREPVDAAPPGVAIRGNISRIPEPPATVLLAAWAAAPLAAPRRAKQGD